VDGSSDEGCAEAAGLFLPGDIRVLNKADLPRKAVGEGLALSLTTGEGLEALQALIVAKVVEALGGHDFPAVTRMRHARLLSEGVEHLDRALAEIGAAPELAAEDVRLAARALGRVTGRIDPEDVLEQVFGKFCIGK